MIQIRKEIDDIISGKQPKHNNLLRNAPHPLSAIVLSDKEWNRCVFISLPRLTMLTTHRSPYSREEAAYPMPWLREKKFWPTVSRVDDGGYLIHAFVRSLS